MAMETKAFAFSGTSVVILVESNNEKKIRENLQFPVLTATLLFNGETLIGHHQGMRAMRKERTFKSRGLKVCKIEASGEGQFVSPQLTYSGGFRDGKFHDLSGTATCTIGGAYKYTGGFAEGHLSGYGAMDRLVDGAWHVVFHGTWKLSKPQIGTLLDPAGKELAITTNVGGYRAAEIAQQVGKLAGESALIFIAQTSLISVCRCILDPGSLVPPLFGSKLQRAWSAAQLNFGDATDPS